MTNFRINPEGIGKLFLYIILGTIILMILPHALRLLSWFLAFLQQPPELPTDTDFVRLGVWTVVAGLLIGIAIRLARKI